ncbi:MAG: hypothetical protein KGQ60_15810 [Planctomycetes bacterium]|nr:hypothetical protein [Planctomycetota bacterium]
MPRIAALRSLELSSIPKLYLQHSTPKGSRNRDSSDGTPRCEHPGDTAICCLLAFELAVSPKSLSNEPFVYRRSHLECGGDAAALEYSLMRTPRGHSYLLFAGISIDRTPRGHSYLLFAGISIDCVPNEPFVYRRSPLECGGDAAALEYSLKTRIATEKRKNLQTMVDRAQDCGPTKPGTQFYSIAVLSAQHSKGKPQSRLLRRNTPGGGTPRGHSYLLFAGISIDCVPKEPFVYRRSHLECGGDAAALEPLLEKCEL